MVILVACEVNDVSFSISAGANGTGLSCSAWRWGNPVKEVLAPGPGHWKSGVFLDRLCRVDVEGILRCPRRLSCEVDGRGYGQRTLKELAFELQLKFSVWLCLHKEESLSWVPAIDDGCPDVCNLGKAPMSEHLLALQCEETKALVPTMDLTMWPFLIYLSLF